MTIKFYLFIIAIVFFITGCVDKKISSPPDGMADIPAGEFIMGSNDVKTAPVNEQSKGNKPLYADEYPESKIYLDRFYIDKFEATNDLFWRFNKAHQYSPDKKNHPVSNITWFDAEGFCKNIGKRLPLETEWEKAARGSSGNIYPWGNSFEPRYANTGASEIKDTTPVGIYEDGKSIYGVYDMIGNVGEWTADWYKAYPGSEFQSSDFGERLKVIRGSSWGGIGHYKLDAYDRASFRRSAEPSTSIADVGVRCAMTP